MAAQASTIPARPPLFPDSAPLLIAIRSSVAQPSELSHHSFSDFPGSGISGVRSRLAAEAKGPRRPRKSAPTPARSARRRPLHSGPTPCSLPHRSRAGAEKSAHEIGGGGKLGLGQLAAPGGHWSPFHAFSERAQARRKGRPLDLEVSRRDRELARGGSVAGATIAVTLGAMGGVDALAEIEYILRDRGFLRGCVKTANQLRYRGEILGRQIAPGRHGRSRNSVPERDAQCFGRVLMLGEIHRPWMQCGGSGPIALALGSMAAGAVTPVECSATRQIARSRQRRVLRAAARCGGICAGDRSTERKAFLVIGAVAR